MKTEYKVVPAPEKARKQRGLKGAALFAHSVEALMNELAAEGWQYVRADTLPQEERSGLTSKVTTYRNLLVFQRIVDEYAAESPAPATAPGAPAFVESAPKTEAAPRTEAAPEADDEITNLWHASDDTPEPLVADRQSQRVDL